MIPTDQYLMLDAIRKGVPAVALERDQRKSPVKELLGLSESLFTELMPLPEEETPSQTGQKTLTKTGFRKRVKTA